MKILFRFLDFFKKDRWSKTFYFMFFCWIIVSAIWSLEPFFFSRILNFIEDILKKWDFNNAELITNLIQWWVFIIIVIFLEYLYRYYIVDKNILQFYVNLIKQNSSKAISITYSSYLWKKQWETFKRFDRWRIHSFSLLFWIFSDFLPIIISIFFIFIIMSFINIKMTLIVFSLIPIAIYLWYYFWWKTVKKQRENNDIEDRLFWDLSDSITNLSLVKLFWLNKKISLDFNLWMEEILEKQYSISKRWSIAHIYIEVLIMTLRFVVLVYWIFLVKSSEMSLAELFMFFSYIWWIYYPIWKLFSSTRQVQEQIIWIEKFYTEFYDDIELEELNKWKTLTNFSWNISFRKIDFSYIKNRNILNNLSFEIKSWEKIALVWNTWAWKSTIINLILWFYDNYSWDILLDWTSLKDFSKISIREHIWVVSQDNSLFNTSIKQNLLFAKEDASLEELELALKNSQADFVFWLELWIDTVIWERWLKLSWWEKQRISIARLFLKNPKFLILDEATSALDNKTEILIQKALDKLLKWRTSIIIAHRLTTIQNADKILMLENWKVVESWKYDELIQKQDKFFNLANPSHLIIN